MRPDRAGFDRRHRAGHLRGLRVATDHRRARDRRAARVRLRDLAARLHHQREGRRGAVPHRRRPGAGSASIYRGQAGHLPEAGVDAQAGEDRHLGRGLLPHRRAARQRGHDPLQGDARLHRQPRRVGDRGHRPGPAGRGDVAARPAHERRRPAADRRRRHHRRYRRPGPRVPEPRVPLSEAESAANAYNQTLKEK